MRDKYRRR